MENRHLIAIVAAWTAFAELTGQVWAAAINVPNASFESPTTGFVSVNIDAWQKSAKPGWYVEDGGFLWTQLTGLFKNPLPGSADHIDNCDGDQALWLFAVPEVALFQDYESVDWNDPSPTHAFDARFEPGQSYRLTVGLIGGGGGMLEGVSLEISLYYRDGASNKVTVAATSITNSPTLFSNTTHFVDLHVQVPTVKAGDAWAGQNIGVLFLSTVSSNLQGGYWDLDNVRLSSVTEPALLNSVWTNGQFQFTLQTEPGRVYEVLTTSDVALPLSNWESLGTVTNLTGSLPFVDTAPNPTRRFYRVRQLP